MGRWSESAWGPAVQPAPGSCGCRWRCPHVHLLTAPLTAHNPTLTSCSLATTSRPLWNVCLSEPKRHHDATWGERSGCGTGFQDSPTCARDNRGTERGGDRERKQSRKGKGFPGALSRVRLFVTPWTVHGILQARILEWVAIPFSRGSSQPRDRTQVSHIAGRFFHS